VAVQAVSRAFNYCLEQGVITSNPVKGLKATRPGKRVTYFTSEVEETLYRFANPALALAIKVCIHTGARPICEFGRVEARHVQVDEKGNMVWWFSAKEAKVKSKPRVVRIARCIVPLVEEAMKKHPTGKLFRDPHGKPWTIQTMHCAFTKVWRKLMREKVPRKGRPCKTILANLPLGSKLGSTSEAKQLLEADQAGHVPAICGGAIGAV